MADALREDVAEFQQVPAQRVDALRIGMAKPPNDKMPASPTKVGWRVKDGAGEPAGRVPTSIS